MDDRLALVQVGNGKIADKKFIVVMDLRVSTRTGGIEFFFGIITALVFLLCNFIYDAATAEIL